MEVRVQSRKLGALKRVPVGVFRMQPWGLGPRWGDNPGVSSRRQRRAGFLGKAGGGAAPACAGEGASSKLMEWKVHRLGSGGPGTMQPAGG